MKRYKTVSWMQLLETLDKSITLQSIKEGKRVTEIPQMPPQTLLSRVVEYTDHTDYVVTGFVAPQSYPFYYQPRNAKEGMMFTIMLPTVVYKAVWRQGMIVQLSLSVTLDQTITKETALYRWPFSNVYPGTNVCWNNRVACPELAQAVEKGVFGFLQTPNNADLFGIGRSQNSSYSSYEDFLRAVEQEGLHPEWLIPLNMNVEEFHHNDN